MKKGDVLESKFFDVSKLSIQCNKDSCYEHIAVGINKYLYGCVSLLAPECAVCLCVSMCECVSVSVCMCLCEIKSKYQHYMSDLSKLIVCTSPPFCWGNGGCGASYQIFINEGGLKGSQFVDGGCWEKGVDFFQGGLQILQKKNLTKIWKT